MTKYYRMLPVYLASMAKLEEIDREVWSFFQDGNLSIQKNLIPFTALGRDHGGERLL